MKCKLDITIKIVSGAEQSGIPDTIEGSIFHRFINNQTPRTKTEVLTRKRRKGYG